jgi:hypothetical protein
MPVAGAYTNVCRLIAGRLISVHRAAFTTITLLTGAVILWLSPWLVDALIAGSAAAAWTFWLEQQELS